MTALDTQDRFTLIRHGDADAWIEAVAAEMAQLLNQEITAFGRARMLLSGGTTPAPVYQALAELDVHWDRVEVSLVDERWLSPQDRDSNAWLVRESFLTRAEGAHFDPLVRVGKPLAECVYTANLQAQHSQRPCLSVLGMATTATPPRCSPVPATWPAPWTVPCPMRRWMPPAARAPTSGHCASP